MKIGISLPATTPGATASLLMDWAKRADEGPYSSLGIIDRLVYPNFESLVTLAAAAAITQRIRLMSTIIIAPLRNTAILAKQAATIDALSNGRLTLGLGVGARKEDYDAAGVDFSKRGKRLEEQLAQMRHIWSGQDLASDVGSIGPSPVQPGGPELLIGGYSPTALSRIGRWADGFISGGGGDPDLVSGLYRIAEEGWQAAGRPGRPRFVGGIYCALGPDAEERAAAYMRSYYSFQGAEKAELRVKAINSSPKAIKTRIKALADVGMDELIIWPCISDLDQIDRMTDLIGQINGI